MATVLGIKQRKHRSEPITVPDQVVKTLGLEEGDELVFIQEDGRIFIQRGTRRRGMTLDEIIANPLAITEPHSDDFDAEIEEAMEIETRRYLNRDRLGPP